MYNYIHKLFIVLSLKLPDYIREKLKKYLIFFRARVLGYFKLVVPEDGPPEVDETKLQSIDGVIPLNWC